MNFLTSLFSFPYALHKLINNDRREMLATSSSSNCARCGNSAKNRCGACKSIFYCSTNCQREDWKRHKAKCKAIQLDQEKADSHSFHKREFDRIRLKYRLDLPDKAEQIAELLTQQQMMKDDDGRGGGVSAKTFAETFGMTIEESVVFLEWIKVGVKFKEDTLDVAKKAGIT